MFVLWNVILEEIGVLKSIWFLSQLKKRCFFGFASRFKSYIHCTLTSKVSYNQYMCSTFKAEQKANFLKLSAARLPTHCQCQNCSNSKAITNSSTVETEVRKEQKQNMNGTAFCCHRSQGAAFSETLGLSCEIFVNLWVDLHINSLLTKNLLQI